jgi:anti-anti-sigma regulatory factor
LVLLTIDEDMDVERARQAEADIAAAPSGGRLVLDLSEVPRFEFAGVALLLDALARLRDRFSGVSILGLSERMAQVFLALRPPEPGFVRVHSGAADGRRAGR